MDPDGTPTDSARSTSKSLWQEIAAFANSLNNNKETLCHVVFLSREFSPSTMGCTRDNIKLQHWTGFRIFGILGTSASATYSMKKWCHLKLGILTNLRMIAYIIYTVLYFYRSTFLGTNITYPLPKRHGTFEDNDFPNFPFGGICDMWSVPWRVCNYPSKKSPLLKHFECSFLSGQSRAQSWSWSLPADPGGSNFNGNKRGDFTVAHHHQSLMIFARCKWWALRYKCNTWLFVYFLMIALWPMQDEVLFF